MHGLVEYGLPSLLASQRARMPGLPRLSCLGKTAGPDVQPRTVDISMYSYYS